MGTMNEAQQMMDNTDNYDDRQKWRMKPKGEYPIVGLSGLIGSGKTFAAEHLSYTRGFYIIRFAKGLKSMLHAIGLKVEHTQGHLKEVPCDLLQGKTPRYAMQTLGTEWGRELIGDDIWVSVWENRLPDQAIGVVCDDCRFLNEAEAVMRISASARLIRCVVGGTGPEDNETTAHASERQHMMHDTVIINNFGGEFLKALDQQLA